MRKNVEIIELIKMPPKDSGMSSKTLNKKKEKVVEDLTFGLKNKNKSKVVQKYVKEVTDKVMYSNVKVRVNQQTRFRVARGQSKNKIAKRRRQKRTKKSRLRCCKRSSSRSLRSRPTKQARLTIKRRCVRISRRVSARRARSASTHTI